MDVGRHDTSLRCTEIGIEIQAVAFIIEGRIQVVHIVGHLDKQGILLPQVSHVEIIAGTSTRLNEIHQGLLIVHLYFVEAHGLCGILEEQLIVALRRADLVVVDLHARIHIRELLTLRRTVVGTVVEAVAHPRGI